MNAITQCDAAARERHRTLDFIGLRAHATTVGLIQLCEELLKAGILTPDGLERIKGAIKSELTVCNARVGNRTTFDDTLKRRLDAIFPQVDGAPPKEPVGPLDQFEDALVGYNGA
ncbi:hypothetical protein FHR22_000393 [Sphingopyxis panaciterrae]|uniref:hypothetical protein n=1 Tax=Sphingopyxis panaciterrae TaxID=363841 RepID=UPI0014211187|nr:hypothetical protein [Sphingopyxis panaciterrae]NIJ35744.1 hypothetical protein [Sphingopyxis panaciterrae]